MSSINQADFVKQGDDVKRYKEICSMDVPLNSPGLSEVSFQDFLGYLLPRVELQLALMFTVAQALHALFKRFSFPRNFSEILVFDFNFYFFKSFCHANYVYRVHSHGCSQESF